MPLGGLWKLLPGLRMFLISALVAIISFSGKGQLFLFTVIFQIHSMLNACELELWPEREVVSSTGSTTYELPDLGQVNLPIKSSLSSSVR